MSRPRGGPKQKGRQSSKEMRKIAGLWIGVSIAGIVWISTALVVVAAVVVGGRAERDLRQTWSADGECLYSVMADRPHESPFGASTLTENGGRAHTEMPSS